MTIEVKVYKPADYGNGWTENDEVVVGLDSYNKVLYFTKPNGEKIGFDTDDLKKILNFFLE